MLIESGTIKEIALYDLNTLRNKEMYILGTQVNMMSPFDTDVTLETRKL